MAWMSEVVLPVWVYSCLNCGDVQRVEPGDLQGEFIEQAGAAKCECSNPFGQGYVEREVKVEQDPTS